MANYDTLKATIDAYIRANGVKAITGPVLNGVLRAMVESVAGGLLFKGIATPAGDPGTPDQNVFFLATDAGTYTNYGGAVLDGKHAAFFVWAGSWTAYLTGIPTDASLPTLVSQLANDAGYITADSLADFYTKAETDSLLAGKQATLESGTNIKTINGESILGSGDITIQGGGSEPYFIRGTIDFNQDPPAVTITSGTYAEALAAYNAGTPVYAALTEGNGAVNIYPLAQVISPFLVFIGIGADSVLAVALQSDGPVIVANSALVHPSDLAPVATSGNYEDLTNKPTIPAAQVQSDWNEADNTDPAYIKNKPTIPGPEVFWAEYGVTTAAEIDAAISNNKLVAVAYAGRIHIFSGILGTDYYFNCAYGGQNIASVRISNGVWYNGGSIALQQIAQRVTSWGATPSDSKYPSEKLVYDSLGKKGVIRQTQTWTQAADGGYDYTMSNPVRGIIPQANIDLFESAGAVFNEQTGYFELNGLTDLSYEDMFAIYGAKNALRHPSRSCLLASVRTVPNFPTNNYNDINPDFEYAFKNSKLEILFTNTSNLVVNSVNLQKVIQLFYNCIYLKKCGYLRAASVGASGFTSQYIFYNCFSLEDMYIRELKGSIRLDYSPRLTTASILFMIEQETASAAFTITLHATAYARATADPAVQAALAAHTNVTLASA